MIEFDVLSEHPDGRGELLVAHDYEDMRSRTPLTLKQALAYLAGDEFAGVEFDLDAVAAFLGKQRPVFRGR